MFFTWILRGPESEGADRRIIDEGEGPCARIGHSLPPSDPNMLYLIFLCCVFAGTSGGSTSEPATAGREGGYTEVRQDTVVVRGQVDLVGSEPFTRMHLVEKGGGGYILSFEGEETIELRRTGPTHVRVVGVPYDDTWQGKETPHLRVIRWSYGD